MASEASARTDWERRVGRRSHSGGVAGSQLAAPPGLTAEAGAGHVTLRWEQVDEAIGYLVHRSADGGPFEPVDHGGRDLLIGPGPVYADTTGERGREYSYAVGSVGSVESGSGPLSEPVRAAARTSPAAPLELVVHPRRAGRPIEPIWHMVGSEHVSQLEYPEIGPDFADGLALARSDLGADRIRAHAILHDELGVYREVDGQAVYEFSRIGALYDRLLELGLRPVVELSFMPRDLARDPDATVFEYRGIISPPRDWDRWGELNRRLASFLVDRYGVDEVTRWGFEVWNEANLEVFWAGTQADYFRLYETAARAIKDVDDRLLVGGPATAAGGWVTEFLDFVVECSAPLDFFSTHTYGHYPVDVRRALAARGLEAVQVWWTEWGATPTHFNVVSEAAWAAPFVLHGMKGAQGRLEALAYWVVSDHFEELGRPPRLFHGGFGLLTVGNLRKPRWWALALLEQLSRGEVVEHELRGDGVGSLVDAWAARHEDGAVEVLLWNGTLDQSKAGGDELLARRVQVRLDAMAPRRLRVARVDAEHSNIERLRPVGDWPSDDEWRALREADRLWEEAVEPAEPVEIDLPMPGIVRLRFES